jgi:hypothetical protein
MSGFKSNDRHSGLGCQVTPWNNIASAVSTEPLIWRRRLLLRRAGYLLACGCISAAFRWWECTSSCLECLFRGCALAVGDRLNSAERWNVVAPTDCSSKTLFCRRLPPWTQAVVNDKSELLNAFRPSTIPPEKILIPTALYYTLLCFYDKLPYSAASPLPLGASIHPRHAGHRLFRHITPDLSLCR